MKKDSQHLGNQFSHESILDTSNKELFKSFANRPMMLTGGYYLSKTTEDNLRVEKVIFELEGKEVVRYLITEDGVPLPTVNRWLLLHSVNSYLTGQKYAYILLKYFRFLRKIKKNYTQVTQKKTIESYIMHLLGLDEVVSDINGILSLDATKNHIERIKDFYNWLEDNGVVENNPAAQKKGGVISWQTHNKKKFLYGSIWSFNYEKSIVSKYRYAAKQSHIKWYSDKERSDIYNLLPTGRDKLIFNISIETGMRISEIFGIRLIDFDQHERELKVRRNINIENEALAKTAERDLLISEEIVSEIVLYIRGERLENDIHYSEFLFINHKGKFRGYPVRRRNFLLILKKAAAKAGLNPNTIRTHSGRSTRAQYLIDMMYEYPELGITEHFILEELGWKNRETLKNYTKSVDMKKRRKLLEKIREKRPLSPGKEEEKDDGKESCS